MKCKRTWVDFNKTDQRDSSWLNALPSITKHQARTKNPSRQGKEKTAGKAMYKISKINTIFIIGMLQNKVP